MREWYDALPDGITSCLSDRNSEELDRLFETAQLRQASLRREARVEIDPDSRDFKVRGFVFVAKNEDDAAAQLNERCPQFQWNDGELWISSLRLRPAAEAVVPPSAPTEYDPEFRNYKIRGVTFKARNDADARAQIYVHFPNFQYNPETDVMSSSPIALTQTSVAKS